MSDGTSIGSLYYDLDIDDKNLKSKLDDADHNVKSFSEKLHDGLNKAAAGFAVVGAGLTLISKNATDFTVQAVKSAKTLGTQIGVSTEEASRLVAAFGRMGISAEQASQVFGIFSKNIVKATQDAKDQGDAMAKTQVEIDKTKLAIKLTSDEITKNGDKTGELAIKLRELNITLKTQQDSLGAATNAFQKLGISTVDAQGKQKDFNTILFEVADKFKTMPNGIDKTALAMQLFGRQGKDMIKVLNLGSAGIQDLEKQADKLGLTLTSQNIAAVNQYIKAQKDLKQSTDALKIAIGTTTAPVLAEFNNKLNEVVLKFLQWDSPLKTATVDVVAFGGPVFAAASGVLALAANLSQAGPMLLRVAEALRITTAAQWLFNIAVAANPIGLLIIALAALVVALVYVSTHMQETGAFVVSLTDKIARMPVAVQIAVAAFMPLIGIPLLIVAHWSGITGFFSGLMSTIASIARNYGGVLASVFFGIGVSMMQGLINGAVGQVGALASRLKSAIGGAVSAVKGFLGIHSPSTVFMEIGKNVTAGFVKGINDTSQLAINAMGNLGNNIISPTMNVTQNGTANAPSQSAQAPGATYVHIGQINDKTDADYILRRVDRNWQLSKMGMSPVQPGGSV
jgi:hypothetical protein